MKSRLEAGDTLFGFAVTYAMPAIIETSGRGFDWIWIDSQHGLWDRTTARNAVRATDLVDSLAVIRVPGHEYGIIGPFIDLAPAGVMVPMVDTGEQAAAVVQAVHFPPLGNRSFGGRRMIDRHGRNYPDVPEAAPFLIAQIETPLAVDNLDAIAGTPGVDSLFFGAADYALRLDVPMGSSESRQQVDAAAEAIAAACQRHGKFAGLVAGDDETVAKGLRMGYQIMSAATDAGTLKNAAHERLEAARSIAGGG